MQMQAQPKMTAWITGAIVALILIGAVWSMTSRSEPVPEVPGDILWTLPVEEQNYYQSLIDGLRRGGPPKDGIPPIDDPVIMGHENIGYIAKAGRQFQER